MVQLKKELTIKTEVINRNMEKSNKNAENYLKTLVEACKLYGVECCQTHIGTATMVSLIEAVNDGRKRDELMDAFELYTISKTTKSVFQLIKNEEIK